MRRWFCIFVLLYGFTGQDYVWRGQTRPPTATEQPIERLPWRGPETQPASWWLLP